MSAPYSSESLMRKVAYRISSRHVHSESGMGGVVNAEWKEVAKSIEGRYRYYYDE